MNVRSGQVWKQSHGNRLVRVIAVIHDARPYARVENLETGRMSRVSLDQMTGHQCWTMVREDMHRLTRESGT